MTDTSGYPAASPPPSPPPMPASPPAYAGATMAGDQPVVDPLAWPIPPTTGLPALSAGEMAKADALYATLLPLAQRAYVEYVMVRTPHLWQDYMGTKVAASVAP